MRTASAMKSLLVLISLLAGVKHALAQSSSAGASLLRPGDHLRITVLREDPSFSGEFEIAPDSTLKHPLYNQVRVAGIPLPMLKERIASFLRQFQREPQLEVEPLMKVSVGGQVRSPNVYFLPPETTIADAITRAGGATDIGSPDQVTVTRDGRKLWFSLNETDANQQLSTIRSGDQIAVPQRRSAMSRIGEFAPLIGIAGSILSLIILANR
jgi:protein involved in polysaccharide export with SLBB domain